MAVFRIERTKDYTVMSNHHLRNHELSLKAKGLLSMMLWRVRQFSSVYFVMKTFPRKGATTQPAWTAG